MGGDPVQVKVVERDGAHFIGFAVHEKIGRARYNPAVIQRLVLLDFCVIIKEEIELDGHTEEEAVDLR